MNMKTLLVSLVLGSSSLAAAAPAVTVTTAGSYDPIVRDHRAPPPAAQPITQQAGWHGEWKPPVYRQVTLASGLQLAAGGRSTINVGSQTGRFATLQISASGGRTTIASVYVQFADGQTQMVKNLDRTLAGNESLSIDLDGGRRAIRRITLYSANKGGWRRNAGTIRVTAA